MDKINRVYIADKDDQREEIVKNLMTKPDIEIVGQTDDGKVAEEDLDLIDRLNEGVLIKTIKITAAD